MVCSSHYLALWGGCAKLCAQHRDLSFSQKVCMSRSRRVCGSESPRRVCGEGLATTEVAPAHLDSQFRNLDGTAGFEPISPTPKAELEQKLEALRQQAPTWAATPASDRAALLRRCIDTTLQVCGGGPAT